MKKYDIFGLGNALVDVLVFVDDAFLDSIGANKGVMTLVDKDKQDSYLAKLTEKNMEMISGGSVSNSLYTAVNTSGGSGVFIGKATADQYGYFYKQDMERAGIVFGAELSNAHQTGTCLSLVTPDSERTMFTHLGTSTELTELDVNLNLLKQSKIAFIEGYLWDKISLQSCSKICMENAKKHDVKIAFTYSDPFCVNRFREDFINLSQKYVDIVFCNSDEAKQMAENEDKMASLKFLSELVPLVFMTDGKNGAYISNKGKISHIESFIQEKPVDTTGAGDAFAGGVLYGITNGFSFENSCKWGNFLASKVIMQTGGRITKNLEVEKGSILG